MIEITSIDHFKDLLQTHRGVVLDIYADWCGPCKVLSPKLEQFAQQYQKYDLIFVKSNIENKIFQAKGLPTIEFYVGTSKVETILGADVVKIKETLKTLIPEEKPNDGSVSSGMKKKNEGGYKTFSSY